MMAQQAAQRSIPEAVTAVFVHQDEIYMMKRQYHLKAFPGYHAFPGGKVERDEDESVFECSLLKNFSPRLMRALCREIQEELDFNLEESIAKGQVLGVHELGVAVTPDFNPIRFKTYFYRIDLKEKLPFKLCDHEMLEANWQQAHDLMSQFDQGKMLLVPPLVTLIHALGENIGLKHIPNLDFTYDETNEVPCIESIRGVKQPMPLSNTLPPANRTNAFVIGDKEMGSFLIDPSPGNDQEMHKLLNVVRKYSLRGIFLTHHHPDHHERSPEIARQLKLPIHLGRDTHSRITQKWGANYFSDITLNFHQEGDVLTTWLGKKVLIYELPGHDEGQLGLAPESGEWFLVGDLIQGIGTVVVAAPEGDMQKYFKTLEKVISLDPQVILPSHGIAMGSVYRLKETLLHRKQRETQVLDLYLLGKSKEEILAQLYADVDRRLWDLALCNIESHLEKLRREKKIT